LEVQFHHFERFQVSDKLYCKDGTTLGMVGQLLSRSLSDDTLFDVVISVFGFAMGNFRKFIILQVLLLNAVPRRLLAKVVGEEHFGGFLKKVDSSSASDEKKKTWKEKMEEIISRSKKAKVGLRHV